MLVLLEIPFYFSCSKYLLFTEVSTAFTSFCVTQAYGRDLAEAYEWCKKYQSTNNVKDLTQAWELYYHVFRRISKQLPQVGVALALKLKN